MIRSRHFIFIIVALSLLFLGTSMMPPRAAAQYVPRISKDQLKAVLGQPGLILIDVRRPVDWNASNRKIKGAVRADPRTVGRWVGKFPRGKTIVLYCA